jgi:hypothetical protein
MRLNARTGAAILAIVVGLALIVFAALGSKGSLPGTRKPAPEIPIATGTIAPLDPMAGVRKGDPKAAKPEAPAPGFNINDIFETEYGDRGTHEVTVSVQSHGIAGYSINWRDGKAERGTTNGFSKTRKITGGFPLAQVGVQGLPANAVTCTITVDGAEKATKTTSSSHTVAICSG